jgi:hypothetical protein
MILQKRLFMYLTVSFIFFTDLTEVYILDWSKMKYQY